MLKATTVSSKEELEQIYQLNQINLRSHLSQEECIQEGFLTWLYSPELLEKMHELAPSVIVKDADKLAGYALTTLRESGGFHTDLATMFHNLEKVQYGGRPLQSCSFYCMGQICVAKEYRGRGVAGLLYQKHRQVYGSRYDLLLTEISTRNHRSQKAHEKVGFRTIYTYSDHMDEWNVVVWNWQ